VLAWVRQRGAGRATTCFTPPRSRVHINATLGAAPKGLVGSSPYQAVRLWHALPPPDQSSADVPPDGNLWAIQILLGHTKLDSTVRYREVDIEDALAEATDI
jgi:hypothetical protein